MSPHQAASLDNKSFMLGDVSEQAARVPAGVPSSLIACHYNVLSKARRVDRDVRVGLLRNCSS